MPPSRQNCCPITLWSRGCRRPPCASPIPAQRPRSSDLQTRRHAALYSLGRLDEADEVFQLIDNLCTSPLQRLDPTIVQVKSLTHRLLSREAIGLGVELLRLLGVEVPEPGEYRRPDRAAP